MKEQPKKKKKIKNQNKETNLLHEMFKGPEILKLKA